MFTKRLVLNMLCEFGPILFFFAGYGLVSFSAGIAAMMLATLAAIVTLRRYEHSLPYFALFSSGTVLFFGGLALVVDSPSIFIFRDTIFDIFAGIALLISVRKERPLFKYVFSTVFAITEKGWMTLTRRWGYFFLFLAVVNETVRITLSSDAWVIAKALIVVATVAFGCYQFTLTRRERLPSGTAWGVVK